MAYVMNKIGLLAVLLLILPTLMLISGEDVDGSEDMKTTMVDDICFRYDTEKICVVVECTTKYGKTIETDMNSCDSMSCTGYPDAVFYAYPCSNQYFILINGVIVTDNYPAITDKYALDNFGDTIVITAKERSFELFCYENESFSVKKSEITIGNDFTLDYRSTIDEHNGIWNTEPDGSGIDVIPGINNASEIMLDSVIQNDGKWGIPLYPKDVNAVIVNYDLCGGNGSVSNSMAYCWNDYTIPDIMPTNDGFTFMYWTMNNEQYSPGTKIQIEEGTDYTFKAVWKMDHFDIEDCDVTVDGIKGGHASVDMKPIDHYEITSFNLLSSDWNAEVVSNDGIVITTDSLASKPEFEIEVTPVMYDMTLLTKGGTLGEDWIVMIESNKYQRSFNVESGDITLPTPQRDGYTFIRWVDENNMSVKSFNGLNDDVTLTADWEIIVSDDDDTGGPSESQVSESEGTGSESGNGTQSSGSSEPQSQNRSEPVSDHRTVPEQPKDEPVVPQKEPQSDEPAEDTEDAQEYIVKFYLNESDTEPYDTIIVRNGYVDAPVPSDIDGMEFVRWIVYVDGEITEFDGNVSDDMIVQAEWKEKMESAEQISVETIIIIVVASILGSAIALKLVMTFLKK